VVQIFDFGPEAQLTEGALNGVVPGVNFINFLRATFAPIFFHQKNSKSKCK